MLIYVRMLASADPFSIRAVYIPDLEIAAGSEPSQYLELVFRYGQNDIHPKKTNFCLSGWLNYNLTSESTVIAVSPGDVIVAEGRFFMVQNIGFAEITAQQLAKYESLPLHDRRSDPLVQNA